MMVSATLLKDLQKRPIRLFRFRPSQHRPAKSQTDRLGLQPLRGKGLRMRLVVAVPALRHVIARIPQFRGRDVLDVPIAE